MFPQKLPLYFIFVISELATGEQNDWNESVWEEFSSNLDIFLSLSVINQLHKHVSFDGSGILCITCKHWKVNHTN